MTSWPLKSTFYYEGIMNVVLLLARLPLWIYAFPEMSSNLLHSQILLRRKPLRSRTASMYVLYFFFLYLNCTLTLIAHHYQAWQKLCCSLILERVLVVNSGV